jgi:hypothetical protein
MSEKIGVITEQGDLGIGFNPISLKEQEQLEKTFVKEKKKDSIMESLEQKNLCYDEIYPIKYIK